MKLWQSEEMDLNETLGAYEADMVGPPLFESDKGKGIKYLTRLSHRCLTKLFEVPRSATSIWIVVHDRPHPDRVKVEFVQGKVFDWIEIDGQYYPLMPWVLYGTAKKLARQVSGPVYAEVYYREE